MQRRNKIIVLKQNVLNRIRLPGRGLRFVFRSTRIKMVCFDRLDPGSLCFDQIHSSYLCFDCVRPRKNISTKFDRGKTFRPSSTEEFFRPRRNRPQKSISTVFDQRKTFRLSSIHFFLTEKRFDREKKNILTEFD